MILKKKLLKIVKNDKKLQKIDKKLQKSYWWASYGTN